MQQSQPSATDLSLYNNDWYRPGSPVKRACWYLINEMVFKTGWLPFYGLKRMLLRLFGAKLGKNVFIKPGVNIKYPWFLSVGDHTWIGEKVWVDNLTTVSIGANVCLSQGCLLLCGNHNYTKRSFDLMVNPIVIDDGVWIGAHAVVAGGVRCNSHSVLTVGSVATQDLQAFGIYRGNPAEKVRDRMLGE